MIEEIRDYTSGLLGGKFMPHKKIKDINILISYLKMNSISFIYLYNKKYSNRYLNDFLNSKEFKKQLEFETLIYNKWIEDFRKIKNRWENNGIEYIFHKSVGELPYLSGNLDVIVKIEDFKKAHKILLESGYIDLRNIQEPHKKYYRGFVNGNDLIPIHLHERVCWLVPFEDNNHLWENYIVSKDDDLIHYPGFNDALLIICAHHFLEDHRIGLFDIDIYRRCIKEGKINWQFIISTAEFMKWDHSLFTILLIYDHFSKLLFDENLLPIEIYNRCNNYVKSTNWLNKPLYKNYLINKKSLPLNISHLWVRRHTILRELKDPFFGSKLMRYYQVFGGLFDRLIQLKLKIKSHPNFLIVLSGLDGSGKTSHIDKLKNSFTKCDLRVTTYWNRSGSMPLTKFSLRVYRILKFGSTQKNEIVNKSDEGYNLPSNCFFNLLWNFINIIDIIVFYNLILRKRSIRGKIIIVDRYLIDNLIEMAFKTKNDKYLHRLYLVIMKFVPTPDLHYFLDVNPEIVVSRGIEESYSEMLTKYKLYKKYLAKSKGIEIVNNQSQNFNFVSNNIVRMALTRFFSLYPEKYSGYKVISFRYK